MLSATYTAILVFQSSSKKSRTFWTCHCPSHLSAHIHLINPCALQVFWKKTQVYGQGRMQPCSISSLSSEKWRIRASGCSRTALCLSVHPSRAIPGICMISETFPFPVCSGVRIHSGSSLHLQSKVNNF